MVIVAQDDVGITQGRASRPFRTKHGRRGPRGIAGSRSRRDVQIAQPHAVPDVEGTVCIQVDRHLSQPRARQRRGVSEMQRPLQNRQSSPSDVHVSHDIGPVGQ